MPHPPKNKPSNSQEHREQAFLFSEPHPEDVLCVSYHESDHVSGAPYNVKAEVCLDADPEAYRGGHLLFFQIKNSRTETLVARYMNSKLTLDMSDKNAPAMIAQLEQIAGPDKILDWPQHWTTMERKDTMSRMDFGPDPHKGDANFITLPMGPANDNLEHQLSVSREKRERVLERFRERDVSRDDDERER